MIKLSIIIPMYNTEPYIDALLKALAPQLTPEVELIVVDDGSNFPFLPPYPSIKVFRHDHNLDKICKQTPRGCKPPLWSQLTSKRR